MPQLDPEQWAELQRLLEHVENLPTEERAGFLERECPDEGLRHQARSLLEYSSGDLDTLDAAIAAQAAAFCSENDDPDHRLIGARLGAYKVETILGHGGMGAVYAAYRDDGEFRQRVAVKLVRTAAQSPATLQRFKQERQILASLAHANIARLLDGGSTFDGVPYLVMEYIQGEPITAWCHRQSLALEQRLRLFLSVCDAVEFAHRKLVVHRDLKPANILVTAEGVPKLLDFGIAKMLAADEDAGAATATIGALAMTPEYAAPEQVRNDPVSQSVDVYALGLVLYELLTGQKAQVMPDHTPATVAHVICQAEPVPPAVLKPELAGDLDTIIRMAIRKDPARRYASVANLALDVRHYLDRRPVAARPDTMLYRTGKFLGRNRAAVTGGLITAILFGAGALSYWWIEPGRLPRAVRVSQLTLTGHVDSNGLATDGSNVYFMEGTAGHVSVARVPVEGGSPQLLASSLAGGFIWDISPDRNRLLLTKEIGLETPLWEMPASGGAMRRIGDVVGHSGAWSPDGKTIAFCRGTALFTMNTDGTGLRKLVDTPGRPQTLRWSPVAHSATLRYTVRSVEGHGATLWQVQADGAGAHPLPEIGTMGGTLAANDDGNWVLGGRYYLFSSLVRSAYSIWAVNESPPFLSFSRHPPTVIHSTSSHIDWLTPSPDGKRAFFISRQERRQFLRYDAARREFVPYLPGIAGRWLSFSADGRWVAYTTATPETLWRSRADGSEAVQLAGPPLRVFHPAWSPDGNWIVFTGFQGPSYAVYAVPAAGGAPQRLTPPGSADSSPAWSPDGSSLLFHHNASPGDANRSGIYRIDWKTRKISAFLTSGDWSGAIWSPKGHQVAVTSGSQIGILDTATGQLTRLASPKNANRLLWSRNGRYVYYQEQAEAELPIYRVAIDSGKVEHVMSSKQIPQSDFNAYILVALAPDDAPIASLQRTNADIFSLDLDLP